jgi:hypothetical protein
MSPLLSRQKDASRAVDADGPPEHVAWLECSSLELLGEVGDVSVRWRLEDFLTDDTDRKASWFDQLDVMFQVPTRLSPERRIKLIKDWIQLELAADIDFDQWVKNTTQDKRDFEKLYAAGAATIMLLFCNARKRGKAA